MDIDDSVFVMKSVLVVDFAGVEKAEFPETVFEPGVEGEVDNDGDHEEEDDDTVG